MARIIYPTNNSDNIRRELDKKRDNLCGCLYDLLVVGLDKIKDYKNQGDGISIEAGEIREQAESELVQLIPKGGYIDIRDKDKFAKKIEGHGQMLFRKSDDYQPVSQELIRLALEIKNFGKKRKH